MGDYSEQLLGRRVKISVGEPWDFSSPDGDNLLFGSLMAVCRDEVVIKTTPFILKGVEYDVVQCRRRYASEPSYPEGLLSHQIVVSNFGADGKFLLIGSIRLLGSDSSES